MKKQKKTRHKKLHHFKPGDSVYAIHDERWGLSLMTVQALGDDSSVLCLHSQLGGRWFHYTDIQIVTDERTTILLNLLTLQRKCRIAMSKAFPTWYGKDEKPRRK